MTKVRQDAWSHEDDLLLAETVLRHIREGSTQLNAFEEVGDKLNRTSAACGFRWNAEIRKKYINAIDLAKRQRKEKKRALEKAKKTTRPSVVTFQPNYETTISNSNDESTNVEIPQQATTITLETVIQYLSQLKKDYYASNQSKVTLDHVQKENQMLKEQINKLEKQLSETEKELVTIQEDYKVFVQIMDRARKMTVLEDQGSFKAPAFRMDKNGNLEQIAQGSN
ncbi:RsfA family transcriptional regulator [Ornithinibacillus halotolerans]|uniref:Prespore-specific transcriptional regulator RsfA n=1 Tax=Ornithinibacillus halotolerans TaxID=1274357 RepID=A0A916W5A5_9BACI|nr:RsfA family transcriptional regulator [Ornithinibacillus halotolerans]GGA69164.1 prespore-specific transcriptional regulator RsfA [Ornithinibacillus halotolerans]